MNTTIEKTAEVNTYKFEFDKVDGASGELLPGAEFQFLHSGTVMDLVEITAGQEYRIATTDDTETTQTITTTGSTVTIYGLDTDTTTYTLKETKAPTGYNKLDDPIEVKASDNAFTKEEIKNNKGTVLPSTGGSGTTIFYVIGGLLIIGAAVVLVARRKAQE